MYREFRHFIEKNELIRHRQRVLLAVSGGIDSMAMLHLFSLCEWNFAIAHCNFTLRGKESDGDAELVEKVALDLGKQLFIKKFDTEKYASEKKLSIQVAARHLRYNWFDELCNQNGFDVIAVAHNANDVAETMLMNLVRGTGLKGLSGIKSKNGKVIRPLLFANRGHIELFVSQNNVEFRNDSSNKDNKYTRNLIRNTIIPTLCHINPSFIESINSTAAHLSRINQAVCEDMFIFHKRAYSQTTDFIGYSIYELSKYTYSQEYILSEFEKYGFSPSDCVNIYDSLLSQPGKEFFSSSHRVLRDREYLMVTPISPLGKPIGIEIDEKQTEVFIPLPLIFEQIPYEPSLSISTSNLVANIDMDTLCFPLTLREWKIGDWFIPFGMKGKKKISDFLIDAKVPRFEKDSVYVIESSGRILWVVGYRIDNRFAVQSTTKKILRITLNKPI
jgi:tRNA(Ile)-lysidine synthase